MKKFILSLATLLFAAGFAHAQLYAIVDGALPNGNTSTGGGGRAMMYMDVSPKVQFGLVGRAHRFVYNVPVERGSSATKREAFNEMSIGAGMRYHFINDVNSNSSLYVNPTFELSSFRRDDGLDFNLSFGYTVAISPLLNFVAELGARRRMFMFDLDPALDNRFTVYGGMGFGMRIPYFGGNLRGNSSKYR